MVKTAEVVPADEAVAGSAGALLGRARSRATIDAFVAAIASAVVNKLGVSRCVVLSSDPDDMGALLDGEPAAHVVAV
ncbi:MAG: hypothetical protein ACP5VR_12535 [Acidimicrobiales bacterium]